MCVGVRVGVSVSASVSVSVSVSMSVSVSVSVSVCVVWDVVCTKRRVFRFVSCKSLHSTWHIQDLCESTERDHITHNTQSAKHKTAV